MYHFKTNVFIPELGKGIFTTFTYISVFSKMDATSPLTIPLLYIQKIYFSAIKLCLEYVKFFRVPGVWPCSADIVLSESPVATLIPPLGAVLLGVASQGHTFSQ